MSTRTFTLIAAAMLGLAALPVLAQAPLKAQKPIVIPGGPGGFDWMLVDANSERVFATHKGTKSVAIVDLKTDTALAPAVGPHGLAIDRKGQRLFTAGSNGKLAIIDMKTGKVTATLDIPKGVDQIAFDRGNQRLYCACSGFIAVVQTTDDGAKLLANVPSPKGPIPSP